MKDEVAISLHFEHFLSFLFGKRRFHGHCGNQRLKVWKKDLRQIIDAVSRAVLINLDTDEAHRDEIIEECRRAVDGIKNAEHVDEVNCEFVIHLTQVTFMILGEMPDNWDAGQTSHRSRWTLDTFRKIGYFKTAQHRANRLMDLVHSKQFNEKLPVLRLGQDPQKYVDWFRINRPDLYERVR